MTVVATIVALYSDGHYPLRVVVLFSRGEGPQIQGEC